MGPALIGVTSSEYRRVGEHHETPEGEPPRREMALGVVYGEAVARAGGLPVILAPVRRRRRSTRSSTASTASASPAARTCTRAPTAPSPLRELGPTEPDADAFELQLARKAAARGMPILGVCRGMQVMNVAAGGTLRQHLPDHRQDVPGDRTTHAVRIVRTSRLRALAGRATVEVNSFHHQAPDRLGDGLRISARSTDGVIEGLEDPRAHFHVGVQWHAECLTDRPEHLALFEGLVSAAARQGLRAA